MLHDGAVGIGVMIIMLLAIALIGPRIATAWKHGRFWPLGPSWQESSFDRISSELALAEWRGGPIALSDSVIASLRLTRLGGGHWKSSGQAGSLEVWQYPDLRWVMFKFTPRFRKSLGEACGCLLAQPGAKMALSDFEPLSLASVELPTHPFPSFLKSNRVTVRDELELECPSGSIRSVTRIVEWSVAFPEFP